MMKLNKMISLIILFAIMILSFSNLSFAADINSAPQDYGSFENYLQAIANESATALDEKALEIMVQSFGDDGYNRWEDAKNDKIGRFEVDDDDDNTGDREVILSQISQEIESLENELRNSYDSNYRDYGNEYYYNFFVDRRSSIQSAVESSNSQEATEAFENFLAQGTAIITRINSYIDQDLTADELSAAVKEVQDDISNLNTRLNTLRARNDMTESQVQRMEQRFEEVNNAYRNLQNAYSDAADSASSGDVLYYDPDLNSSSNRFSSLDDMINDGDNFINSSNNIIYHEEPLQEGSSNLYNIFLEVGVALAVIIGLIIGIRFMLGSVEEKAEIKKLLWPYLVGCLVIFGAFGIWKIMLEIMQSF